MVRSTVIRVSAGFYRIEEALATPYLIGGGLLQNSFLRNGMPDSIQGSRNTAGIAERRTRARWLVSCPIYVNLGSVNGGLLSNISEDGVALTAALTARSQLRTFFAFFALMFIVKACVFMGALPEDGRVETKPLPFDNGLLAVCR